MEEPRGTTSDTYSTGVRPIVMRTDFFTLLPWSAAALGSPYTSFTVLHRSHSTVTRSVAARSLAAASSASFRSSW